ncbi:MAG: hypothetical protein ACI9T7_001835, partial [Oleiphilaceae bacterium]
NVVDHLGIFEATPVRVATILPCLLK